MPSASSGVPPFSPVLFAGLLLRPVPKAPLNLALSTIIRQMHRRHPEVFQRVATIDSPIFLITPTDLPFSFYLNMHAHQPALKVVDNKAEPHVAATISGPLTALMALLEGRIDGDALFFSRTLTISGDTEAVLALRNAVDGSEINLLDEAKSMAGPMSPIFSWLGTNMDKAWKRSEQDFTTVAQSLTAPLANQIKAQQDTIEALEQKVRKLSKRAARKQLQTSS